MSHTLGPWTCDEGGLVNGMDSRERFAGSCSLDIFDAQEWPDELYDEAMANARLIAAAPALLEACKAALVFIEHEAVTVAEPGGIIRDSLAIGIRAAIALATTPLEMAERE